MNTMVIVGLRENSEEFGELKLKGTDMQTHVKLNLGFGIGYQHQLDKNIYLNILPSYNMDLRSERAFNSLTLTAELIFGIY
jgi:hypothetical protein